MEPVGTRRSLERDGSLGALAVPESDSTLASARERALQRLLEVTALERDQQAQTRASLRRDFLRTSILSIASAGAFGTVFRRVLSAELSDLKTPQPESEQVASTPVSTGVAFMWENILFQVGLHAFAILAWEHELPLGNATVRNRPSTEKESLQRVLDLCEKDPWLYVRVYRDFAWSQPAFEELLFRIVPSVLCPSPGAAWHVGIPTSLAFAAAHNLVSNEAETRRSFTLSRSHKLSLDYVPLTQFLLGAFCWYTVRRYGELAPVLAHVFNNQAAAISIVLGGRERQYRYQQLLQEEIALQKSEIQPSGDYRGGVTHV